MASKIAVAKIELALGRNCHNTLHHSTMTDRKRLCGTGRAQNRAVPYNRDPHLRPHRTRLSGSLRNPQSQKRCSLHSLQRDPEVTTPGPSSNFSSPSCLRFLNRGGRRSSVVGQRNVRLYFVTCQSGFPPSLPYHPQDQGKLLPSEDGTLLNCRMTFKATGRHSSPRGPDDCLCSGSVLF